MKMRDTKIYYPRFVSEKDPNKIMFYETLEMIKNNAVDSETTWDDFYHSTVYRMADGKVYEYTEDNDYMIPYSIEQIA